MKKILLAITFLLGLFVTFPILSAYYKHLLIPVSDKPHFVLDEDTSDFDNYQKWLAWTKACHPPRNYLYKTLKIRAWYDVQTSWFDKTYFFPKEIYYNSPRPGCPSYESWLTKGFDTPFGYSDIPLKNGARYRIPNTYLEARWITAHDGVYKENSFHGSVAGVLGIQDLSPMGWITYSNLHALKRYDDSFIYTVSFMVGKGYKKCTRKGQLSVCLPNEAQTDIVPYWSILEGLPFRHGLSPSYENRERIATQKLDFYQQNPEIFLGLVGGVHYNDELQASYIYFNDLDKVRKNNPYKVLYFTGDMFFPKSWARCQYLKTDDGKQPIIIKKGNEGIPQHHNLNACMSKIRFSRAGGAQILFQSQAMEGYTLDEFIDRVHGKLESFVVAPKE